MDRLVVATDLSSRSDRALLRAAQLAGRFGCEWTILHVVDDDVPSVLVERVVSQVNDLLLAKAEKLAEVAGQWPRVMVASGNVEETIIEVARGLSAEVLLVGTHRRLALRQLFLGSTSERVIRSSPIPVLRVGSANAPYERLLLALDLSPRSADVLRTTRALGLLEALHPMVLHAFVPGEGAEAQARQALRQFFRGQHVEFDDYQLLVAGEEPLAIVSRLPLEVQPQLLAIGTPGRETSDNHMHGSVAVELLRGLDCDILCVPPRS
ncbi:MULTISPECIES: universal stress protein [Pseudomonas]|uniref:Nucleotide-binding universal stress protein, UspA family n=1 Tax=Pseudomonas kuykendallii TaxID=1007099 RepID=A0A1H2YUE6_9PSED|nr:MULTISPECIES: universal stress protein [Pseudomonas]MCQ4269505.1 universal stress protein [Pseudomonas kuykendallii]SDX08812.1 Nucleotide-binding universal stress protein, UspA family [Pseudomonas kuykendallii]